MEEPKTEVQEAPTSTATQAPSVQDPENVNSGETGAQRQENGAPENVSGAGATATPTPASTATAVTPTPTTTASSAAPTTTASTATTAETDPKDGSDSDDVCAHHMFSRILKSTKICFTNFLLIFEIGC